MNDTRSTSQETVHVDPGSWLLRVHQDGRLMHQPASSNPGSASVEGGRFRHTARFLRWRPDRDPASCTYDQLDVAVPAELHELFTV